MSKGKALIKAGKKLLSYRSDGQQDPFSARKYNKEPGSSYYGDRSSQTYVDDVDKKLEADKLERPFVKKRKKLTKQQLGFLNKKLKDPEFIASLPTDMQDIYKDNIAKDFQGLKDKEFTEKELEEIGNFFKLKKDYGDKVQDEIIGQVDPKDIKEVNKLKKEAERQANFELAKVAITKKYKNIPKEIAKIKPGSIEEKNLNIARQKVKEGVTNINLNIDESLKPLTGASGFKIKYSVDKHKYVISNKAVDLYKDRGGDVLKLKKTINSLNKTLDKMTPIKVRQETNAIRRRALDNELTKNDRDYLQNRSNQIRKLLDSLPDIAKETKIVLNEKEKEKIKTLVGNLNRLGSSIKTIEKAIRKKVNSFRPESAKEMERLLKKEKSAIKTKDIGKAYLESGIDPKAFDLKSYRKKQFIASANVKINFLRNKLKRISDEAGSKIDLDYKPNESLLEEIKIRQKRLDDYIKSGINVFGEEEDLTSDLLMNEIINSIKLGNIK